METATRGKLLLVLVICIYVYYTLWVIGTVSCALFEYKTTSVVVSYISLIQNPYNRTLAPTAFYRRRSTNLELLPWHLLRISRANIRWDTPSCRYIDNYRQLSYTRRANTRNKHKKNKLTLFEILELTLK